MSLMSVGRLFQMSGPLTENARRLNWLWMTVADDKRDVFCDVSLDADVAAAGQSADNVVDVPPPPPRTADRDASTPPGPPSSSTSRIPRLTSSLRRHLPVLAGLRHDRDRKPPPPPPPPCAAATIGTVQPATPPSSKVRLCSIFAVI